MNYRITLYLILCMTPLVGSLSQAADQHWVVTTLTQALDTMSYHYATPMAYALDDMPHIPVRMDLGLPTIEECLQAITSTTPLSYRYDANGQLLLRYDHDVKSFQHTISGRVRGPDKVGLPYVLVSVEGTTFSTYTDDRGRFEMTITAPPDRAYLINLTHIGLEDVQVVYHPSLQQEVYIDMQEDAYHIDHIVIQQQAGLLRSDPYLSHRQLRMDTSLSLLSANITANVFKGIQLLPGIRASQDMSSGLRIRGGAPYESLVLIDEMPLYRVDHYYGIFGTINAKMLNGASLYQHAFPARYGGHTSGYLSLYSKDLMQYDRSTADLTLGTLTSDVMTVIDAADRLKVMLSARTTTERLWGGEEGLTGLDVEFEEGEDEDLSFETSSIEPALQFYDLQAKVQWQPSDQHHFSALAVYSSDDYQYSLSQERDIYDRDDDERPLDQVLVYEEETTWDNSVLGLNYLYTIDPARSLRISTAHTLLEDEMTYDETSSFVKPGGMPLSERENEREFSNQLSALNVGVSYQHQYRLKSSYQLGVDLNRYSTSSIFTFNDDRPFEQDADGTVYAGYAQWDSQFSDRWHLSAGLRGQRYDATSSFDLSPRVLLGYQVRPGLTVSGSYGLYYQYLQQHNRETQYGRNVDYWVVAEQGRIPTSRSQHFSLSAQWVSDWFTLSAEAYHKHTDDVFRTIAIDFIHPNNRPDPNMNRPMHRPAIGSQDIRGVDVMIKKESRNYATWLTYTLSENELTFDEINGGSPFASEDDIRHQVKWALQWKISPRIHLQSSYTFSSGRIYTDISTNLSEDRRENRPLAPVGDLQERLPDYHRFDVGLSYRNSIFGLPCQLGLNVFNVFDHDNVVYKEYLIRYRDRNKNQDILYGTEIEQLGFTPQLYMNIRI